MPKSPFEIVSETAIGRGITIATAESVTAGYVQFLCSGAPRAGLFFQGGITVYNSAQKAMHLGVDPIVAEGCQGVSPAVTAVMAKNCSLLFNSTIGLGITGFAESGTSPDGSVYAFISICADGEEIIAEKLISEAGSFENVQKDFGLQAFLRLIHAIALYEGNFNVKG